MKLTTKRLAATGLYCTQCYLRIGIGEPHLIQGGQPYHKQCFRKRQAATSADAGEEVKARSAVFAVDLQGDADGIKATKLSGAGQRHSAKTSRDG